MTFTATYDNVVVKVLEEENVSSSGIVLAGPADKTHHKAVVKYVGPGKKGKEGNTIPLEVKVGDTVLFGLQVGIKVLVNGENCLVVKADDIFAVED